MPLRSLVPWAVAAIVLVMGALYLCVPPNPDQAIFDYAGWIGAQGGHYYLDVAEQNFPGAMMVHELGQRIFGNHIWTIRATDFVILLAGCAALFDLLRRAGMTAGAWIAVPLYVIEYTSSGPWMAGQRDLMGANLLLGCSAAYARRISGGTRWWLCAASLCLFGAALLRPTYLAFGAVLAATDLLARNRTGRTVRMIAADTAILAGVFLVSVALLVVAGLRTGSLRDWYEQAIVFNLQAYSINQSNWGLLIGESGLLTRFAVLIALAVVGFVVCSRIRSAHVAGGLLAGLALTALVSTIAQGKGYGYHLGALIPAVCALASAAVSELYRRHRLAPAARAPVAAFVLTCLTLFAVAASHARMLGPQIRYVAGITDRRAMLARAYTGAQDFDWEDVVDAVDYVDSTVLAGETVLVWARPVGINSLSERRSPTRFITFGMLELAHAPFERASEWNEEFRRAFDTAPPRVVFTAGPEDAEAHRQLWDESDSSEAAGVLRKQLTERYDRAGAFGGLEVYRLRER